MARPRARRCARARAPHALLHAALRHRALRRAPPRELERARPRAPLRRRQRAAGVRRQVSLHFPRARMHVLRTFPVCRSLVVCS